MLDVLFRSNQLHRNRYGSLEGVTETQKRQKRLRWSPHKVWGCARAGNLPSFPPSCSINTEDCIRTSITGKARRTSVSIPYIGSRRIATWEESKDTTKHQGRKTMAFDLIARKGPTILCCDWRVGRKARKSGVGRCVKTDFVEETSQLSTDISLAEVCTVLR